MKILSTTKTIRYHFDYKSPVELPILVFAKELDFKKVFIIRKKKVAFRFGCGVKLNIIFQVICWALHGIK